MSGIGVRDISRRVLVVAAHPDDEILGVGATVSMHATMGHVVGIVILGEGETSRRVAGAESAVVGLGELARAAAESVGATLVARHLFPDNAFDSVPLLDIVKVVEGAIASFGPDRIYTHHAGDLNIDHELTCRAVCTAARPVGLDTPDVLTFEVRSSTDWAEQLSHGTPFRPNYFVSVTHEAAERKRAALRIYEREMRPFPHSRSHEAVDALLTHRGAQAGVPRAEAFHMIRAVR